MQLSDYKCPITANCPITTCILEQNRAVYAPITFEDIVTVMIKREIVAGADPENSEKGGRAPHPPPPPPQNENFTFRTCSIQLCWCIRDAN